MNTKFNTDVELECIKCFNEKCGTIFAIIQHYEYVDEDGIKMKGGRIASMLSKFCPFCGKKININDYINWHREEREKDKEK